MIDVFIRWMIRRDRPRVLEIENLCFEFPWTEEDFICCLKQRNCIAMVAEIPKEPYPIMGFMVYELLKCQLHVLNFAVAHEYQRQGVGTKMVEKLKHNLYQQRRKELVLEVRESNLAAQMFFRSQGFGCDDIIRGHYEDTPEDAYVFRHVHDPDELAVASRSHRGIER